MSSVKRYNCTVCGIKYWAEAKAFVFNKKEVNFCPTCWTELEKVVNIPDERTRKMNEFMSAIGGYTHIVINRCHGGFSLSHDARVAYLTSLKIDFSITARESRDSTSRHGPRIIVNGEQWFDHAIRRDDPYLVQVIRDLGDKANGVNARLKIVSIPSEVVWDLHDYDGIEWIAETHRVWN